MSAISDVDRQSLRDGLKTMEELIKDSFKALDHPNFNKAAFINRIRAIEVEAESLRLYADKYLRS